MGARARYAGIFWLSSTVARGQFGGAGGYSPPAPICPAYECGKDEVAVGKEDHQIWSYGCKDAGMNIFNTMSMNPNDPLAGLNKNQKNFDKCCIEKDICRQTCGMTSKACHDKFQSCTQKICRGEQNCQLQAMMAEIMSEPAEDRKEGPPPEKYDATETKCRGYNIGQKESCTCVPKSDFKVATESKLKSFYRKFNAEKLNKAGEIKDVDDVWKKWKGKEPDMFMALATKYKDKAVERREKPKYKPPPASDYTPPDGDSDSASAGSEAEREAEPEVPVPEDKEADAFDKKHADMLAQKQKAKDDEDYDLAMKLKGDLDELKQAEVKRVNELKTKAIEDEDYKMAKEHKKRLARLSEL
eukprot:TRINITY_DN3234_c1_g1_i1.p1 TRINITY_DN3234_c1_g1~~TRINITY_DN3234_c1_g1_i1.p1  ORF type:complete len:357 (+),score=114.52 TRINITY_DN3234_c1_g1_i1:88-1158(+)